MRLITRNVDTAFRDLVTLLRDRGSRRTSRNGPVIALDEPILITYERPLERVLVNRVRDANPFFHLYHALWLLAGRDDVKAPAYYVKKYLDYSDDGETANGSYGRRWRNAFRSSEGGGFNDIDQLHVLVDHLKSKPDSRRAVLQMWNVEDDLLEIDSSKDVCCNTAVYATIRDGRLDVTVTNRSNDLVWGCLGEDYVTFSVLQEYLAARVGVSVGRYHHLANDLHAYESNWEPDKWLADETLGVWNDANPPTTVSLVSDPTTFDRELIDFVQLNGDGTKTLIRPRDWQEPFFSLVAQPLLNVFHAKKRKESPDRWFHEIAADDWRVAATNWCLKRSKT